MTESLVDYTKVFEIKNLKFMYCIPYDDVGIDNLMADINEAISNTNSIPQENWRIKNSNQSFKIEQNWWISES